MSKAVDNEALGEMDENETRYYLYKVPFQIQSIVSMINCPGHNLVRGFKDSNWFPDQC